MIITAHGLDSFKLSYGTTTITCNPRSKKSKLGQVKGSSTMVLSSLNHIDYAPDDAFGSVSDGDLNILGAGAYGKDDVMVQGLTVPMTYDGTNYVHGTMYLFDIEDTRVCFCGPITTTKVSDEVREALASVQIMFVPIGGGEVLSADDAYEFAVSIEPNLIIPTHYDAEDSDKDALQTFLSEAGTPNVKAIDKLTTKKKEIADSTAAVVVLNNQQNIT